MIQTLRIATRKSALAMWQARHVRSLLEQTWPELIVEFVPIVTTGDRFLDRPLALIGGKGLFLKELELALLSGEADLAVHSMKDVPGVLSDGLSLDVVLPRATPFDALVCRGAGSLAELPEGSRVGTSSARRQCQLLAAHPGLQVTDLRGNVDTRLRKLDGGHYDAIILACAGLERLGLSGRISEQLKPPHWIPACTQGIIALQYRSGDKAVAGAVQPLNDPHTAISARAERTLLRKLQGSCQLPLAVYAHLDDTLLIQAMVGMPDGSSILSAQRSGSPQDPEALGERVAEQLLLQGAGAIISRLQLRPANRSGPV